MTRLVFQNRKLILASASPRRREILQAAGIAFDVIPTELPERPEEAESTEEFVRRMAAEKAKAAFARIAQPCQWPILGADTVVVIGKRILGKPASQEEARQMLRWLSGQEHQVLTGLCLLYPPEQWPRSRSEPDMDVRVAVTGVKFCELSEEEMEQYIATGEPFDKAGGYAIQGQASKFVEWVRGCYFNVVGLPVSLLYQMLQRFEAKRRE
ncbi:MAG: septum formation protein Maf [Acidobacteria bacterium RIFCSPLOWO2_12_FULL_59_11]|nr:MAG: septum formation protein Maf [Acidobacteria bacterium RIFCSPLOWO2_12_FULL_59_11]